MAKWIDKLLWQNGLIGVVMAKWIDRLLWLNGLIGWQG